MFKYRGLSSQPSWISSSDPPIRDMSHHTCTYYAADKTTGFRAIAEWDSLNLTGPVVFAGVTISNMVTLSQLNAEVAEKTKALQEQKIKSAVQNTNDTL